MRAVRRAIGRTGRRPDDRGETLIEILVAVAILGVAVVAILGAIATSIRMSDVHRKQARAGAYLRTYAEEIQAAVNTSGYVPCAALTSYPQASFAGDGQLDRATVTAIEFWNGLPHPAGAFVPRAGATDIGIQRLSLRMQSTDSGHLVSESLDVIIRRPATGAAMPGVTC